MRTVFLGVGAWVGQYTSATRCQFWPVHPSTIGYDPSLLVAVDLALRPGRAPADVAWDDVQVDDHTIDGGLTTIGPELPDGSMVGAAYLAESFFNQLGAARPAFPPGGYARDAYPYELTAVVYHDPARTTRRYLGYHAEIVSETATSAQVKLWPGGAGRVAAALPPRTIFLGDLDAADAPVSAGGLTEIGLGAGGVKVGALYLSEKLRRSMSLMSPKLPPGLGEVAPW